MQQVPAEAALYYAALCGCRLPTAAEWRQAYASYERSVPPERWNLRDQTWTRHRKYVAAGTPGAARWPDEAAFRTRGDNPDPTGADAKARPQTDGTLFFRKVNAAGAVTFRNLVGNVAEFVCDAPDAFETWPDKGSVEGIRKFVQQYPGTLYVIGGSALSPPDAPVDRALPVPRADVGYADVGLRLAFTAPRGRWLRRRGGCWPGRSTCGRRPTRRGRRRRRIRRRPRHGDAPATHARTHARTHGAAPGAIAYIPERPTGIPL